MGNRRNKELRRELERKQEQKRRFLAYEDALARPHQAFETLPHIGRFRLGLEYRPSFEPNYSWQIMDCRTQWRVFRCDAIEGERGIYLGYHEIDCSDRELRDYFGQLSETSIPIGPMITDMGGLDGTLYQLTLEGDMSSSVRLKWWSEPPPTWKPITDIVDGMIADFLSRPRRSPTDCLKYERPDE